MERFALLPKQNYSREVDCVLWVFSISGAKGEETF